MGPPGCVRVQGARDDACPPTCETETFGLPRLCLTPSIKSLRTTLLDQDDGVLGKVPTMLGSDSRKRGDGSKRQRAKGRQPRARRLS